MSTAEKTTTAPAQHHWLRIALAVVALVELADALSSIHNIFTDYHHPTALLRFPHFFLASNIANGFSRKQNRDRRQSQAKK
jgi:hypothetical protein